ncbi:CPSF A subunit region-domain-containing protein [Protomyces lactucae-debilis]|uniref:CPSF A subunit region-domain-containing protein n=1 Tax=Protomyces lactucae-debilis TaxID=2754530 RepID=A0A1Y2FSJ9_PROLT|nr:CPSF A subunit region-domain-containing protein [Protomyces lactucae-debilis]ORY86166.1 CPSF A subunit region-domain-containing protein [Protomyces lactucae-debilis]
MSTHGSSAFYAISLLPPSQQACPPIIGHFSGLKQQEVIVATGATLTVYKVDNNTGKLVKLASHEAFGILRTMAAFRLTGSSKDYVLLCSDSGRLSVLEYRPDKACFTKIHQETYGKSGVRRVVPGEFMAVDPKGRAVFIASVEKNKLVYVLNRDAAANVTISSPLEALSPGSLLFHSVALDVGYDNPVFATIEVNYSDSDQDPTGRAYEEVQKTLTYYELDLGLNHVVREWTEIINRHANMLIAVPGGYDGPSGVLVCAPDEIVYMHKGRPSRRVPIPHRRGLLEDPDRQRRIVAHVTQLLKGSFFLLVQTEDGDLFKLSIDHFEGDVTSMRIKYFDTVPVATGLTFFKSGYLLVASEFGNSQLYQIERLGDDDDEPEFTETSKHASFQPTALTNFTLVDEIECFNPILDAKVLNLTQEDAPQIYAACGRGARSSFKTIRNGLEVSELVASELPGKPTAIWTTQLAREDAHDAYIVLSFTDGTLVLSIGETVEELTETGFLTSAPTLAVQQLGEDALIQVHPKGIRHVQRDLRVNEWHAPARRTIVQATTNNRQVVVALSSGELVYFELDEDGQLNEYQEKKEMSGGVTALAIGAVPEGRQRNPVLAVACDDSTVRIISLDPDNTLESLSVQALTAPASALCMVSMDDGHATTVYLHIGLQNGIYLRTSLDSTGQLTDTRTRFLGSKPVKLFNVKVQEQAAVLALSSRPWLGYIWNSAMQLTPLQYENIDFAAPFSSDQCPEGLVGIKGPSLRIFTIDNLGNKMRAESHPLSYTPRKFVQHPNQALFYILEADHHAMSADKRSKAISEKQNGSEHQSFLPEHGLPWAANGCWASCIRIFDPSKQEDVSLLELEDDIAAFCACIVTFASRGNELFLAVGAAQGAELMPKSCKQAYLLIYRIVDDGRALELVHKTETSDIPLALCAFQGKLLVGLGGVLRLYDIGLKRCLRKSETEVTSNSIIGLETQGDRIVISDNVEAVTLAVYKHNDNKIICFANDTLPRWTTASTMVDYDTIAGGDRFGNLWIVRVPKNVSELSDNDTTGNTLIHERPYLQGAAHRLDTLAHYHIGDIPTSISKTQLVAGGRSVLVITGIMGSISLLIPFVAKEDAEFFAALETNLRTEDEPLAGRDHMMYRGYYAPPKSVIDGDLCERYALLSITKQRMIAGELDRDVAEVKSKIENQRIRFS